MASQYARGKRFEDDCRDWFREHGWMVIRSAGSKTPVDLVAVQSGMVLFVQCKRSKPVAPAERGRLLHMALLLDEGVPVVAEKVRQQRAPALFWLTGPGPKDRTPFDATRGHV